MAEPNTTGDGVVSIPTSPGRQRRFLPTFLILIAIGLVARIVLIREPLNSDDSVTMQVAQQLLNGQHVLQRGRTAIAPDERILHHSLRLGFVVPVTGAIWLFGYNIVGYYMLPMVTSLTSIAIVFLSLNHLANIRTAFLGALVFIFCPFDVAHSSILLCNLPAAVLVVTYVLSFRTCAGTEPLRRILLLGCLSGLLLSWAYLMRMAVVGYVLPCFVVFLWVRRFRYVFLVSLAVLATVVLAEQALYAAQGFGAWYRYRLSAEAVAGYRPWMAVSSSFWGCALRYPAMAYRSTGSAPMAVIFVMAIGANVYVVVRAKGTVFRVLAACALVNLLAQTFGLTGPLSDGYVTFPAMYRFLSLFILTSAIALPWAIWHIFQYVEARTSEMDNRFWRTVKSAGVVACWLFFLVPSAFECRTPYERVPLFHPRGKYVHALKAIGSSMGQQHQCAVNVIGVNEGIRAIRMFTWIPWEKKIHWEGRSIPECTLLVEQGRVSVFVTDFSRIRKSLTYLSGEVRAKRGKEVHELEESLRRNMKQVGGDGPILVFVATASAGLHSQTAPSP